jgi:hypothetical protein
MPRFIRVDVQKAGKGNTDKNTKVIMAGKNNKTFSYSLEYFLKLCKDNKKIEFHHFQAAICALKAQMANCSDLFKGSRGRINGLYAKVSAMQTVASHFGGKKRA